MRSRASDFCELFSMTLEPCKVGFQRLPAATHGGQQRASGAERNRPRFASIMNGIFGWLRWAPHPFFLPLLAPHLAPHFNDATFSLCGAVWRAESAAAHWEYRMNPLVPREKVRAFAMRHACAHLSLCLSPSPGALPLNRSHVCGSF